MNELKRTISSVRNQLLANGWLKCLLLAISVSVLVQTLGGLSWLAGVAGALTLGLAGWWLKIFQDKKQQAISLIHQTIGDTEYSLPLLDKSELNMAEQLQLERLNERIQHVRIPVVAFSQLGVYVGVLLLAVAINYGWPLLNRKVTAESKAAVATVVGKGGESVVVPAFESATLQIQPPAYTRLPVRSSDDLNATAIMGSRLSWQVVFSGPQQVVVRLANNRGDEVAFKKSGERFVYSDRLLHSGLYAIKAYWNDSLVYQSDFYRLEAQPDLAPKIQPDSKELYQFHYLKDRKQINVSARVSDDFSVSQAFIVATLARGSGENVKFREMKFPVGQANFKEARLSKTIDLKALNFTPGDELYYYWAAIDNKQPEPNFTKSDTYFLVYKDTTKADEAELATMAVNIMPDYFRSQRQIIIDTEKLIARRGKMLQKAFNSTSNEIGYDQKLLRLRYGQYLGEEFETNIGPGGGIPEDTEGKDMLEGFMHKHDTGEGEHEMHDEHEHAHDHGNQQQNEDPLAALMAEYVHSHDDGEANTFYEQSTRSLLKMALEQMWQSELHLRMYEPEKAIPYEKKALEYLKSAQQKARTFVKKSGYDPPPIKEKETRMTGELKNVNTAFRLERAYSQVQIEQLVGQVLGYLEGKQLTSAQKQVVQQLSIALTDRVMNSSLANWSVLSSLQKLVSGKPMAAQEKQQLKTKLYALAGASPKTTPSYSSEKKLEQAFWKRLR